MNLIYGMLLITLAQIISYVQLQGQGKWDFFKNPYIGMFWGIPIGFLLIVATRLMNAHFHATWQGRLIGQGIGVIVFSIMSYILFKEQVTFKTAISITLSIVIILINIYWK